MSKRKVALLQMNSSREVANNLAALPEAVKRAADGGAELVFLPENFACLGHSDPASVARDYQDDIRGLVADLAAECDCWIFAGTMPLLSRPDGSTVEDARVRAASLVYNSDGELVSRYDKIHMFDVDVSDAQKNYRESATFEPGSEPVVVATPIGLVGLTVCYDIRFPELYRHLFAAGVVAFTIPSAFTVPTGRAHFELLCRARAVESFAYVIAACQAGVHDSGRETYGHSMVVNPWGEVVVQADSRSVMTVMAEIDLDRQQEIRANMPVHQQSGHWIK